MNFDSFSCISHVKGPGLLPQPLRLAAIEAACAMFVHRRTDLSFQSPYCEGRVRTAWRGYQVGVHYGTVFKAVIESELGVHEFTFLLSEQDLRDGVRIFDPAGTEEQLIITTTTFTHDPVGGAQLEAASQAIEGRRLN